VILSPCDSSLDWCGIPRQACDNVFVSIVLSTRLRKELSTLVPLPQLADPLMPGGQASSPAHSARVNAQPVDGISSDRTATLCARVRTGDSEAFTQLFRQWFDRVYSMARRNTSKDESFCLDVTQDVFMIAIRKLPVLESEAQIAAWFEKVVVRKALDRVRSDRRRISHESRKASTIERDVNREDAAALDWAAAQLRALSDVEQSLLRARFVEGKSLLEIAGGGTTRGGIHGMIRRAIEKLRRRAKEAFGDD
jgi:RNA polymerase sigma-70 factor (ECF subfamily)